MVLLQFDKRQNFIMNNVVQMYAVKTQSAVQTYTMNPPRHLCMVEDGREAVWHVDDATRVAGHHEQEPVRSLQDQVLQLVV